MSSSATPLSTIPYEVLRFIFAESATGVGAFVDGEGVLGVNRALEELLGYTAAEIKELGGPIALVPDPAIRNEMRTALSRGTGWEGDVPFRDKQGRIVWHHVKTLSLEAEEGSALRFVSWHTDVTDTRRLVEQLDRSAERFGEVMNLIPEAVTIRRGGELEYANRGVEAVFGRTLNEFRATPRAVERWALPEERHKVRTLYQSLEGETHAPVVSRQYRILTAAGQVRWIWTRVFALGGEPLRAMALSADITDTVEVAERLRKKTREADSANRAKSAFLANLTHEIRTPVAGILGLLDLMENESEETRREYRELMRDAAGSLVRMLEDVLDLSRLQSNRLSIVPTATDVNDALDSVVQLMRPRAMERRIELSFEVEQTLPSYCLVDRVRLQQLASNLISNAIKYTDEGHVRVEVGYLRGANGENGRLVLTVDDTGAGMSEGQLSLAFEPFRRINEGYTQSTDGAGLGLPLVKNLVDLMGGTLDVTSAPGTGTRFCVTVPTRPAEEPRESDLPDRSGGATPTQRPAESLEGRVILLAEDNRIVQLSAQTQLSKAGHEVYIAGNGQEAVDIASRHRVDLILMDVQMPVMNGLEAIRRIRADENAEDRVPIVALTAYSSREDQEVIYQAGVSAILTKPCSSEALLQAVWEHARATER